jgi:hypothetical protein
MMMAEKNGAQNVYSMLRYCIDRQTCRKALIAQHFGDTWDEDACQGMCDNCQLQEKATSSALAPAPYKVINAASLLKDILKLLRHGDELEQRMTGLKLMDAWFSKGAPLLRLDTVKVPQIPRTVCEAIVANFLLDGYISEEFHFTPYSTISHLVPGSRDLGEGAELNYTVTRPAAALPLKKLPRPRSADSDDDKDFKPSGNVNKSIKNGAAEKSASTKPTNKRSGNDNDNGQKHPKSKPEAKSTKTKNGTCSSKKKNGEPQEKKQKREVKMSLSPDDPIVYNIDSDSD